MIFSTKVVIFLQKLLKKTKKESFSPFSVIIDIYTSSIARTLMMVTMVVKMRKPRSGRNFTSRMPRNAPTRTNGMVQASMASVVGVMCEFQRKLW